MDYCVLCGKEVQRGGYSSKVGGVVLRPLCPDCDELCSKEPKRVVDEHRDVFERMLAERLEALTPTTTTVATSETPRRSQRERKMMKRYGDAYLRANAIVTIGNTVKILGIVLAALIVVVTLLLTSQESGESALKLIVPGIVVAGAIGVFCYALGILVAAIGQMLLAQLDNAVNSSPFLTDELKAEVMSV